MADNEVKHSQETGCGRLFGNGRVERCEDEDEGTQARSRGDLHPKLWTARQQRNLPKHSNRGIAGHSDLEIYSRTI